MNLTWPEAAGLRCSRRGWRVARISELKGVVLGIVYNLQPCTAYAVRRELRASPSTHWSASGGSIYPLLDRLESGGLVTSTPDAKDRRGRRLLRLTQAGGSALRSWALRGSEPEVAAEVFDAVRARVFFLAALAPRDRERFATRSLDALEGYLATVREDLSGRTDEQGGFEYLAALGGVYEAEARVKWMRELRAHVRSC